jgi:hypothetical protein
VRDDGAFLGETLDVGRFLFEITQRNKKGKVSVAMPRRLEHGVELPLHVFPDAIAPWTNDHAAANLGGFRQLRGADDLLIPLREIIFTPRGNGGFGWGRLIGHARKRENYAWRNEMTSDHFSTDLQLTWATRLFNQR